MRELKENLKKLSFVAKLRKRKLQEESGQLAALVLARSQQDKALSEAQQLYLADVEKLNAMRSTADRATQDLWSDGVNHRKQTWMAIYREIREIDSKIEKQRKMVALAEQDHAAVDLLIQKRQTELRKTQQQTLEQEQQELNQRS